MTAALLDVLGLGEQLDAFGWARIPNLITAADCGEIASLYPDDRHFRSHIVMARHGFGRGEYKYFAYPLPGTIATLRTILYPSLAEIANRWNAAMGVAARFPCDHADFIARCHDAGQTRPTPLLLPVKTDGDFNALHQDVYGEHISFHYSWRFCCRSRGRDFDGGEFIASLEQRPRMQSRVR